MGQSRHEWVKDDDELEDIYLAESEDSLLGSHHAAVQHEEVLVDHTVVGEATHWVDALLCKIEFGATIVLEEFSVFGLESLSDTVDLLVDFCAVMEAFLTTTGDRVGNTARMPSSNTGNLPQTLVSLTWQLLGSPTRGHTYQKKNNL